MLWSGALWDFLKVGRSVDSPEYFGVAPGVPWAYSGFGHSEDCLVIILELGTPGILRGYSAAQGVSGDISGSG